MVVDSGQNKALQRNRNALRQTRLREFQANLAERLRVAATTPQVNSRLGVLIGAQRYLLDLSESGEISSVPEPTPVPMTQPWFKGLFSARGSLYTMIDLAHFMGGDPTPLDKNSRVLALNDRLQCNAAILVTRMLGLRSVEKLTAITVAPAELPWLGNVYEDGDGNQWTELLLQQLIHDERFLAVAA
ncbi:chemotaxis protein CheW [Parvibium lacunae]|uniref:Chemotaxis protein CheW n=1 Tax=Parvibium lacunae TaxID=1888893 RepID=A0A368L4L4_9BURK|nr:chemotaxis protein CheW [Parvibium lacunae]RCS58526.1 chemotaxis protein CheW [Parvibium lacunae]